MHSEIKRFWEEAGYIIDCIDFSNNNLMLMGEDGQIYWTIHKSKDDTGQIVARTLVNGTNLYYFDGKKYSEETMLRVIKMKAFL